MSAAPAGETPPAESPAQKSGDQSHAEKPASPDQIVYPRNSPERPDLAPVSDSSAASNTLMLLAAIALAAAGGWVLFQRRQSGLLSVRGQRKLQIEETRPLGNRQYLVVANYDGKKFLLGITTNKINLLTPLDDTAPTPNPPEAKP